MPGYEFIDAHSGLAAAEYDYVTANEVDFAYIAAGEEGAPLVLCLHGFPDSAHSWDGTLPVLAAQGYRVVAPFMRGYWPSSIPEDGDYSCTALGKDVLALISVLGYENAIVIGHDWGGFAAYTAANLAPEKVSKLIVMTVPHMANPQRSWAQLKRSWYVLFFQMPWLPERAVAKNSYQFIDRLYRDWCPNWPQSEWQLAPVKRSLSAPGSLAAALGYYRHMIRGAKKSVYEVMARQTSVPSLWLIGEADGSIGPELHEGIESAFSGYFDKLSLPTVGHFMHREEPEPVHEKILAFLEQSA